MITLRPVLPADAPRLAAMFRASIHELAEDDYDAGQRDAWAAAADDETAFAARLQAALTIVASIDGVAAGFISLKGGDHVDMLYVDPRSARMGVATQLCGAIEKLATGRGASKLTVDASDNARPFFEGRGYEPRHRQTIALGDHWLGNTRMEKVLAAAS